MSVATHELIADRRAGRIDASACREALGTLGFEDAGGALSAVDHTASGTSRKTCAICSGVFT